jgi:DnaJ homolog subfamily C member 13
VEILLGILDWRAGGRQGLCAQMKWNESEASIGRVLAVEVQVHLIICSKQFWEKI